MLTNCVTDHKLCTSLHQPNTITLHWSNSKWRGNAAPQVLVLSSSIPAGSNLGGTHTGGGTVHPHVNFNFKFTLLQLMFGHEISPDIWKWERRGGLYSKYRPASRKLCLRIREDPSSSGRSPCGKWLAGLRRPHMDG